MFLAHHVDKIVFTKEFLTKRMAHKMESVGLYIGEDFMREFSVSNEDYKESNDVVS